MISFGGVAKPETDATPHRKTEVGRKLPDPKPEINCRENCTLHFERFLT